MTTTLITSQTEIADATTATLVATYNHFTGKNIKAFETRAVAERRVAMALLSAQDLAGHRGTAPNEAPNVLNGVVDHSASNKRIAALIGETGIDRAPTEAENGEGPFMTKAELNGGKMSDAEMAAIVEPTKGKAKGKTRAEQVAAEEARVTARLAAKAAAKVAKGVAPKAPKAPKALKAPKAPKAESIGAFIRAKMAEGLTNEEILAAVQAAKPEAKTTVASIRWYRYN